MPPLPAFKFSPGRELRADSHKRGRSLESGLSFKGKEDGLALFDEMQRKEQDNFLLQSNDDFEDVFATRLKYFSNSKIGVSVPSRGENSDILNVGGEKNDYDWLLTPPDTPLFPSLDDEAPANVVSRGRPRSQPISISRSSTMEKSYNGRSSRGSPSPQRCSPSPRPGSGSASHQSRGRTSPGPSLSPSSSVRNASPVRKPSPTSVKASLVRRSCTPTPRRLSTGSSGTGASSHLRGSSPLQSTRGSSASPKVSPWQSSIPGFSTEIPPNLRTSLADRPASVVRGSSPASRKDMPSKYKPSSSPTGPKSICSFSIEDQEKHSSHSKGSVVSSGDDDVDSLHSMPISTSDLSTPKDSGTQAINKSLTFSRKSNKLVSPSSAPKRSFDYAMRHMDHRKTPQNMFRPLLSSVPSTTLYAGKINSALDAMISRNSSIATSSTASSDQAIGLSYDSEVHDHPHHDIVSQYEGVPDPEVLEDVFVFDKVDGLDSDSAHDIYGTPIRIQHVLEGPTNSVDIAEEDFSRQDFRTEVVSCSENGYYSSNILERNSLEDLLLCSECGCRYASEENAWSDVKLCPKCGRKDSKLSICIARTSDDEASPATALNQPEERWLQNEQEKVLSLPECLDVTTVAQPMVFSCGDNATISEPSFETESHSAAGNSQVRSLAEEGDRRHTNPQEKCHRSTDSSQHEIEDRYHFPLSSDTSSSYFNDSEGDGISILLKRSSSIRGPVVQGRMFKASSIPYDDPSYARESGSFTRSSMGLGSTSASSSVDLGSIRQTENRVQRQSSGGLRSTSASSSVDLGSSRQAESRVQWQSSGKKIDSESYRLKRAGSPSSETSTYAYQNSVLSVNAHENESEAHAGIEYNLEKEMLTFREEFHMSGKTDLCDMMVSDSLSASFKEVIYEDRSVLVAGDTSEVPDSNLLCDDNSLAPYEHVEAAEKIPITTDGSTITVESQPVEESTLLEICSDGAKVAEAQTHCSLDSVSQSENELESATVESSVGEFYKPSISNLSDSTVATSVAEADPLNDTIGISDSDALIEDHRGSLTLDEATETILFSVIQSMIDEAAVTIALEKEIPAETEISPLQPTILGKSNHQGKEPHSKAPNKRTPKPHKPKQKRAQKEDPYSPLSTFENDENIDNQSFPRNVGLPKNPDTARPPKLESKCNCAIM